MRRCWKKAAWGICILLAALVMTGCQKEEPREKVRDLEFTVIQESEIPKPLADVIGENKETEMKLSYQNEGFLYIARGFGQQKTGGYSIAAKECYLAEDGIHVSFELIGPPHDEKIPQEPSYPYIVIKTEGMEEPIIFE